MFCIEVISVFPHACVLYKRFILFHRVEFDLLLLVDSSVCEINRIAMKPFSEYGHRKWSQI